MFLVPPTAVWIAWACAGILVGLFAVYCAQRHGYRSFVGGLLGLGALHYVSVLTWQSSKHMSVHDHLQVLMWSLSMAAVFAVAPGFLFAADQRRALPSFVGVSLLSPIIGAPIWFYFGQIAICAIDVSCP